MTERSTGDTWDEMGFTHHIVRANDVDVHYAEAGEGPLIVFVHGFPGLWYAWRQQLGFMAAAGFHAIAIDLRGFGRSHKPTEIAEHSASAAAADIIGLLDVLGERDAVLVGQDFGGGVVWQTAIEYPERVRAVVSGVPLTSRYQQPKMFDTAPLGREMFLHINYFQEPGVAEAELDGDPHRFLRRIYYMLSAEPPVDGYQRYRYFPLEGTRYTDVLSEPPHVMEWFTPLDLEYFASEYGRVGFAGGLNWYRANVSAARAADPDAAEPTVDVPAMYITGERDPVLDMVAPDALPTMKQRVTDLREINLIRGAGHFVQQEKYAEYNDRLLRFVGSFR